MSFFVTGVRFPFIPPTAGLDENAFTPFDPGDSVERAEKFSRFSILNIIGLIRNLYQYTMSTFCRAVSELSFISL